MLGDHFLSAILYAFCEVTDLPWTPIRLVWLSWDSIPPPSHLCLVPEEGAVPPGGSPETLCVLVLALGSVGESPSVSLLLNWLMGFAQLERRYICDPQLLGDKLCNKGGV